MKYVYLKNGEVIQIVNSPNTGYYDSILSDEIVRCEMDITDDELAMNYFYSEGSFKLRPERPSMQHTWGGVVAGWIFDIENVKRFKLTLISKECANFILAGFNSNALGSVHTYPSNDRDQVNLSGTIQKSLLPNSTPTDYYPFLCANADGIWDYRDHTAAQIQQVGIDVYNHTINARVKNATLRHQINQATTQEELNLIIW